MLVSSRLRTIFILFSMWLLAACAQATVFIPPAQGTSSPAPDPPPTTSLLSSTQPEQPAVQPTLSPTPQPSNEPALISSAPARKQATPTRYRLSVEFDYARHKLAVEEHIEYFNNAAEPLNEIALMIVPLLYPDAFRWMRFSWEDGVPIENYALYPGWLSIPLETALQDGESLSLWIEYELHLPYLQPEAAFRQLGPLGYTELQTNLADWYPFVAPYRQERGWITHEPASYGEHLVYEIADFQVAIQPVGTMKDLVIAASAPAVIEDGYYHYQVQSTRNFTWSASPYYRTKTEKVDDVTIHSYYLPEHWAGGQRVLATTAEALRLYSELFTPYPHASLTVVEADFIDGMEYDGLYFLGGNFYALHNQRTADFLVAVAAHETAHQWWYGLVGSDQAMEPWLDEALSTYCERLYYEQLHPDDLEWWWAYRVMYYQPEGVIDITIYDVQGTNRYRDYRDSVYLNGALFFEELRGALGDESFFAFLRDYANSYRHAQVTGADFFTSLNAYSSQSLSSLLEIYFSTLPVLGTP